jgi:hypothetical protein
MKGNSTNPAIWNLINTEDRATLDGLIPASELLSRAWVIIQNNAPIISAIGSINKQITIAMQRSFASTTQHLQKMRNLLNASDSDNENSISLDLFITSNIPRELK